MNELASVLEQGRQFLVQHAPADVLTKAIPAGIVCLIAGIGFSVLGAKFARFGLTAAAILVGGAAGLTFARGNEFHPLLCVLCGAFLVGIIGYQTFRLWIAVGTSLVFATIVMSVFGRQEILPRVGEKPPMVSVSDATAAGFTLPTAEAQQATLNGRPEEWVMEFWNHLKLNHPDTARTARALSVVALLIGLCVGLIATRWCLILSTSLVGTFFVAVGAAALLVRSIPQSCEAFANNPGLAAAGLGGFLVTSLILQALLSRPAEPKSE